MAGEGASTSFCSQFVGIASITNQFSSAGGLLCSNLESGPVRQDLIHQQT